MDIRRSRLRRTNGVRSRSHPSSVTRSRYAASLLSAGGLIADPHTPARIFAKVRRAGGFAVIAARLSSSSKQGGLSLQLSAVRASCLCGLSSHLRPPLQGRERRAAVSPLQGTPAYGASQPSRDEATATSRAKGGHLVCRQGRRNRALVRNSHGIPIL